MFQFTVNSRFLPAALFAWSGLWTCPPAQAADAQGHDGSVLLHMCKGADNVRMLSVMCLAYIDGFSEAAHYYDKGKAAFCLDTEARKEAPAMIVKWIEAHPGSTALPAADVLQQSLTALFPCKAKK